MCADKAVEQEIEYLKALLEYWNTHKEEISKDLTESLQLLIDNPAPDKPDWLKDLIKFKW